MSDRPVLDVVPTPAALVERWRELAKSLRTSYGVVDLRLERAGGGPLTADDLPIGVRVVAQFADGGRINVLLEDNTLDAAEKDFKVLGNEVDEIIRGHIEAWKEAPKPVHPDTIILSDRKPTMKVLEDGTLIEEAPDLMDWVIGFREWKIMHHDDGSVELGAAGHTTGDAVKAWQGPNEVRVRSVMPQVDNQAGFHAYWTSEEAAKVGHHGTPGVMRARGVMVAQRNGFRAEYAQPLALGYKTGALVTGAAGRFFVEQAARKLGLPAMPIECLPVYAMKFGEVLPESLQPEVHTRVFVVCGFCGEEHEVTRVKGRVDKGSLDDSVQQKVREATAPERRCVNCDGQMSWAQPDVEVDEE